MSRLRHHGNPGGAGVSLGCARCGQCCENITISADGLDKWTTGALEGVPDPRTDDGWAWWQESGWTDRDRAWRWWNPDGDNRLCADFITAHWKLNDDGRTYSCDAFDQVTRLCMAHDERPPVCSGYPWYGTEPDDVHISALGGQCSYLLDVAPDRRPEGSRPLIPLTVL